MTRVARRPRRPSRAGLTRALTRARPGRLDPAAPPPVSWPSPGHFTQRPGSPAAGRPPSRARLPRPPGSGPRRHKLLAAVSSAVAISAVLVVAVLLAGQARQPGRKAIPSHDRHHGTQPAGTHVSFEKLRVIRPWRGTIKFEIRNDVVYLTGFATIHASSNSPITILPASIRPRARLDIPVAFSPDSARAIQISPSGFVRALSGSRVAQAGRIWLSGVSFPVGS